MRFNLKTEQGKLLAKARFESLLKKESVIDLVAVAKKRTNSQNAALHLYFTFISKELNGQGQTFNYTLLTDKTFEMRYTPEIIKEHLWRPIQRTLFNIESTTKIDTKQINEILDVSNKYFSNFGIYIEFPNMQSLIHQLEMKNGKY